ncbi:unnamed protein product, partial [Phaeothamnion confervicola]
MRLLYTNSAREVTSIKLSPSSAFAILGCGVRDAVRPGAPDYVAGAGDPASARPHPVSFIYRTSDMRLVHTVQSVQDDVNVARFHPEPGFGFMYGTKQGRVRMLRLAFDD